DVASGVVRWLIDDTEGGVRDPAVHYDGHTILFSYRRGGSEHYHLHTIQPDGSGLRQLTDGDYDDFEPCWLPDGDIVFVSTRAKRWVNCWITQVATLHRCAADGSNLRAISANNEHDNTPWVLPDGRVIYQRWEYVDRSQVDYHHLWAANPDGTGQMVFYGNQHPGTVMIDAKPVPGSSKVVSIFSPGHGQREHAGAVALVDVTDGPDDQGSAAFVTRATGFRDPWAFSEDAFMVAHDSEILLMDGSGLTEPLYRLPEGDVHAGLTLHEPRPLVPHQPERIIPSSVTPKETTGRVILANVYEGRNMTGVEPGDIRKLLVLETLPKPVNFTGGMDPLTYGGSFTLERVVGTVPVEEDGSAYVELPAMRGLFFVALDRDDLAVKRMQSFLTVQPGEVVSCVGCHEQRTRSYIPPQNLLALRRPPSWPEPIQDCPDVFDYPRDIQPILDRLCVDCHDYTPGKCGGPIAGGVILTGDHGPMFSHSYFTMTVERLFRDGRNQPVSNYAPHELGSAASRILAMLDGAHYDVQATDREKRMLRLWIEVGAPYPGTYGALGSGSIGGYSENNLVHTDFDWPTTEAGAEVIDRRCAGCHQGIRVLPKALSDEIGLSFWRFDMNDPRLARSRHIVFNLSRPEKSLLLLAPLAKE
ncbi:MAG: PD40 domain-containing protein, partial [Verrucomicrobiae bacterium]|nr:PD40 domain-containing protein [Verrucomicrobiae bacterium]